MKIIKKIDDLGRIAIPKDVRKEFSLFGGDEIEIIPKEDEIILRRHEDKTIDQLYKMREKYEDDWAIANAFNDLIEAIQDRTE